MSRQMGSCDNITLAYKINTFVTKIGMVDSILMTLRVQEIVAYCQEMWEFSGSHLLVRANYPQQPVTVGSSPDLFVICILTTSSAHVGCMPTVEDRLL